MIRLIPLIALAASCAPAHAAPFIPPDCMSLSAASEDSRSRGEVKHWLGVSTDNGDMLMMFVNPDGDWTLVRTDGDIACLVDFGTRPEAETPAGWGSN